MLKILAPVGLFLVVVLGVLFFYFAVFLSGSGDSCPSDCKLSGETYFPQIADIDNTKTKLCSIAGSNNIYYRRDPKQGSSAPVRYAQQEATGNCQESNCKKVQKSFNKTMHRCDSVGMPQELPGHETPCPVKDSVRCGPHGEICNPGFTFDKTTSTCVKPTAECVAKFTNRCSSCNADNTACLSCYAPFSVAINAAGAGTQACQSAMDASLIQEYINTDTAAISCAPYTTGSSEAQCPGAQGQFYGPKNAVTVQCSKDITATPGYQTDLAIAKGILGGNVDTAGLVGDIQRCTPGLFVGSSKDTRDYRFAAYPCGYTNMSNSNYVNNINSYSFDQKIDFTKCPQ